MALSLEERIRRANAGRTASARRRRFQKTLQEMRDYGLVVEVQTTDPNGPIVHPDYTPEATFNAVYR